MCGTAAALRLLVHLLQVNPTDTGPALTMPSLTVRNMCKRQMFLIMNCLCAVVALNIFE